MQQYLPAIFAVVAVITGAASLYGRLASIKAMAYCCLLGALGLLWWSSLGSPRPILLGIPQGTVAAFTLDEPNAIYVWLLPPGAKSPISIALPWNEKEAGELVKDATEAKKEGTAVKMGEGKGNSGTDDKKPPMFYLPPPDPLAPKSGN